MSKPRDLERGAVLTVDRGVVATSRILVAIRRPAGLAARATPGTPVDRDRLRLHLGTEQVDALVVRGPREAIDLPDGSVLAILRLARPIAAAAWRPVRAPASVTGRNRGRRRRPRFACRRAGSRAGASRPIAPRRSRTAEPSARLDLHGAVADGDDVRLATDVSEALRSTAVDAVRTHHVAEPASAGLPLPALRAELAIRARRLVTLHRAAADTRGPRCRSMRRLPEARSSETAIGCATPDRAAGLPPDVLAAMDRLEAALAVAAPPSLADAARDRRLPARRHQGPGT